MYIEFCKCQRRILTSAQMQGDKLCDLCQEEKRHAETFKDRLEQKEVTDD